MFKQSEIVAKLNRHTHPKKTYIYADNQTSITFSANTWTQVSFATDQTIRGGTITGNNVFTVNNAGFYRIVFSCGLTYQTDGAEHRLEIRKNNLTTNNNNWQKNANASTAGATYKHISDQVVAPDIYLNAGDTLYFWVWSNSTNTGMQIWGYSNLTFVSITWLGE